MTGAIILNREYVTLTSHYIKQKLDRLSIPEDFQEGSTEKWEQHREFHLQNNNQNVSWL